MYPRGGVGAMREDRLSAGMNFRIEVPPEDWEVIWDRVGTACRTQNVHGERLIVVGPYEFICYTEPLKVMATEKEKAEEFLLAMPLSEGTKWTIKKIGCRPGMTPEEPV